MVRTARRSAPWTAYNHVQRSAKLTHVPNGTYNFSDTQKPYLHGSKSSKDTEDGSFGSFGILRFNVPGHPGIGVHSGRAHAKFQPGPEHATDGCIRTTDEAVQKISDQISKDSLTTIDVVNNDPVVAAQGKLVTHGAITAHHVQGADHAR